MPVAAARQAEVVATHLNPLEVRRRGQHLTQQLLVGGLEPGLLAQGRSRLSDPLGEIVAQSLELTEVEDPGLGAEPGDPVRDLDATEALGEETGELTL